MPAQPRPSNTLRAALAAALCLLATACSSGRTMVTVTNGTTFMQQGDTVTVRQHRDGVRYAAVLDREARSGRTQVYRIRSLEPRDQTLTATSLVWLFRHLDADVVLRTPTGTRIEHPDRGLRAELLQQLRERPADAMSVLQELPRLIRLDSRSAVFAAACEAAAEVDAGFDQLLAATTPDGVLLAPALDDQAPGGSRSGALYECLQTLSELTRFDSDRADRIVNASRAIDSPSYQSQLLCKLVPFASTSAVLGAAAEISSTSSRHEVLSALTQRPGLTDNEAEAIVAAVPSLDSSSYEENILCELLPHATTGTLLHAALQIDSTSSRHTVMDRLADKPNLTAEDADELVAAISEIESSSYEENLLCKLAGTASNGAVLRAAGQIDSTSSRYNVLNRLAEQPDLSKSDVEALVAATSTLDSSSYQSAILTTLIPRASTPAVLRATEQISSTGERYQVLSELCRDPGLTTAEADRLLVVASGLESSSYERQLLQALLPKASTPGLLRAAVEISSSADRYEMLLALAQRDDLSRSDADAIAGATESLSTSSYRAKVLLALMDRASRKVLSDAAKRISSPSERIKVLEALVERQSR